MVFSRWFGHSDVDGFRLCDLMLGLTNLDRLKAISGLHDWSDVGFAALKG